MIAASPTSWGVDYAAAPDNPPWADVLDGVAAAGFRALELGPVGYLPEEPSVLRAELRGRNLAAAGTFLFEPLHERQRLASILALAQRAAKLVAAAEGAYLVVIDHISPARAAAAGDSQRAPRLDPDGFEALVRAVRAVAEVATEHGLRAVFHPHVATYVEFEDETERLLDAVPGDLLGVCLDTGHSLYAGIEPAAYLRSLGDRVECLHLKDVDAAVRASVVEGGVHFDEAVAAGVFCPLGHGALDLHALHRAIREIGFDGYMTVEQDRDPAAQASAVEDARASLAALQYAGIADERSHAQ